MLQMGPQLRPNGNYLDGFFLGLYPGVGYNLTWYSSYVDWHFMVEVVAGNQWVRDSGFTWGLFQGIRFIDGAAPIYFFTGIHLGFTFKNPLIKAR